MEDRTKNKWLNREEVKSRFVLLRNPKSDRKDDQRNGLPLVGLTPLKEKPLPRYKFLATDRAIKVSSNTIEFFIKNSGPDKIGIVPSRKDRIRRIKNFCSKEPPENAILIGYPLITQYCHKTINPLIWKEKF